MPRPISTKPFRPRTSHLSYDIQAKKKAIHRIQEQTKEERTKFVIDTLTTFFQDGIKANPAAFRGRFRKMAATPFNFYRGSAVLFYQDLKSDQDPFIAQNPAAGHVFIHGDLHAENFGTYLNDDGILNFDVNDFDEGYLGPFTWDVKRLVASLNLICYAKGFSDGEIENILGVCVEEYLRQVDQFCQQTKDQFSLTLRTTSGKVKELLLETRVKSHVDHLNSLTVIEDYDRRFIRNKYVQSVDKALHNQLMEAFQTYLHSVPDNKKYSDRGYNCGELTYHIKDIVQCLAPGIGSAGKVSYSFLIEGRGETLENDIILYMKPAQKSALSYVVKHPELEKYFHHDGLRTVLCSYAMQASTPRWLGYSTMNNAPFLVDAVTAHSKDLNWSGINDLDDLIKVVQYLGQATAKIHCVADADCVSTPEDIASLPFHIIPREVEKTIRDAINGRDNQFIEEMVQFGMAYGEIVRSDHDLFFEALRNGQVPGLE